MLIREGLSISTFQVNCSSAANFELQKGQKCLGFRGVELQEIGTLEQRRKGFSSSVITFLYCSKIWSFSGLYIAFSNSSFSSILKVLFYLSCLLIYQIYFASRYFSSTTLSQSEKSSSSSSSMISCQTYILAVLRILFNYLIGIASLLIWQDFSPISLTFTCVLSSILDDLFVCCLRTLKHRWHFSQKNTQRARLYAKSISKGQKIWQINVRIYLLQLLHTRCQDLGW